MGVFCSLYTTFLVFFFLLYIFIIFRTTTKEPLKIGPEIPLLPVFIQRRTHSFLPSRFFSPRDSNKGVVFII